MFQNGKNAIPQKCTLTSNRPNPMFFYSQAVLRRAWEALRSEIWPPSGSAVVPAHIPSSCTLLEPTFGTCATATVSRRCIAPRGLSETASFSVYSGYRVRDLAKYRVVPGKKLCFHPERPRSAVLVLHSAGANYKGERLAESYSYTQNCA